MASTRSGYPPVHRSPQDDYGYDICDNEDIDPVFGSLGETFDELVDAAPRRSIRVVIYLVVNRTSRTQTLPAIGGGEPR